MKKLLIIVPALASLLFSSCLKDKANVDLSNLSYIAEISTASTNSTPNAPSGGLDFYNGATMNAAADDPDTITFTVNIASPYPPTKDVPVTLAVDDAARVSYISNASNVQFAAFPAAGFDFPKTSGTIKAGRRLDTFTVVVHHGNLDPTQSYMLPISIKSASGATISGNLGTIYFHIIGNPLAGPYTQEWIRYDQADATGTPGYDETGPASFVPVSPTSISVESGTGVDYILSFTNTAGVLSGFKVAFPTSGPTSPTGAGITISAGPTIVLADPVGKKFTFNFVYVNSGGASRNITDKFY
ncbi:MAG TPA: DUF1735 domain-containing protein [Puia sp.]|nr:DUF1735 domain-containing protein [Puia sp.]